MTVQLGNARGEIILDASGVRRGVDSAVDSIEGLGGKINAVAVRAGAALAKYVAIGAAAAGAAVLGIAVSGTKMAMALEEQMSGIQAVMSATTDEVGRLEDEILRLGVDPNLKVSTMEAAAAIEMLGRNGLSVTEILEGAAHSTILLANATGADFAMSADIATDVMALFGIEAANMGGAVDGITSVVNSSKFDLGAYQLALAQAGGTAAIAGISFNDFNTSIAAISPNFADGGSAGAAFKTMIQRMAAPTGAAATTMQRLGLMTEDGANAFFDAEGNMHDMNYVASLLNQSMGDLTKEQQLQALTTMFGARSINAATGLMRAAEPVTLTAAELVEQYGMTWEEATAALEDGITEFELLQRVMGETSAADNAATRMDNLAGVIEILRGQVDTIKIRIGQIFIPILTQLGRKMSELVEDHGDKVVAFFGALTDWAGEAIPRAIQTMSDYWTDVLQPAMVQVWQYIEANILPILLTLWGWFMEKLPEALAWAKENLDSIKGALIGLGVVLAGAAIASAVIGIATAVAALASPVGILIAAGMLLGAAWQGNWGGIQEKVQEAVGVITEKLEGLREWFMTNWPAIQEAAVTAWAGIQEKVQEATAVITDKLEGLREWFVTYWPVMQKAAVTAWRVIEAVIMAVVDVIVGTVWPQLQTAFQQIEEALAATGIKWSDVWNGIVVALKIVGGAIGAIMLVIVGVIVGMVTAVSGALATFVEIWSSNMAAVQQIKDAFIRGVIAFVSMFRAIIDGDFKGALEHFKEMWRANFDTLQAIMTIAWNGISGGFRIILSVIEGFVAGFIGFFQSLYDRLVGNSIIPDMVREMVATFTRVDWAGIGRDIVEGIAGAITAGVGRVRDAAGSIGQAAMDAAKSVLGSNSPSLEFQFIGEDVVAGLVNALDKGQTAVKDAIGGLLTPQINAAMNTAAGAFAGMGNIPNLQPARMGAAAAAAAPMGGGGTTYETNEFNLSLSTGQTQMGVIQAFELMGMMRQ